MTELRKVTCKTCGHVANYADEYGPAFAEVQCECDKAAQVEAAIERFHSTVPPNIQRAFIDRVYHGIRPADEQCMKEISDD